MCLAILAALAAFQNFQANVLTVGWLGCVRNRGLRRFEGL